jgi:hypothetical protein
MKGLLAMAIAVWMRGRIAQCRRRDPVKSPYAARLHC